MATETNVVLFSGTLTSGTTAGTQLPMPNINFTSVVIRLKVTAASGTSPTLDVKIQDSMRLSGAATVGTQPLGAYEFDDYAAFTQATAAGNWKVRAVGGGTAAHVEADGALAAGTVKNGPIHGPWRIKAVVAGTNPSFTFSVIAKFIS